MHLLPYNRTAASFPKEAAVLFCLIAYVLHKRDFDEYAK
jgi:hypothetical protein